MSLVFSWSVFRVTCILMASVSDSSSSSLEVHPVMMSSSYEEDELTGWCWVDGAVPDKSLFNAIVIIAKGHVI